jgi:hypothetical protein
MPPVSVRRRRSGRLIDKYIVWLALSSGLLRKQEAEGSDDLEIGLLKMDDCGRPILAAWLYG